MRARLFTAENRKWWTLVAVAIGLFMIMLDNTVVNAYALTFGVLLLTGGKLADLLGRRTIFIAGLVVFTGASLWCGLAGGAGSLIAALALAIGPIVGGLLTEKVNWSWIFFINIPVGVLGIVAARVFIDETKDTSKEQRLDLPGLITSGAGLFALTYGLIETNNHAWTSTRVLMLFAIAVIALGAFVFLELHQRLPMLDLSL